MLTQLYAAYDRVDYLSLYVNIMSYVQGSNREITDDYICSLARARLPGPAVACPAISSTLLKK